MTTASHGSKAGFWTRLLGTQDRDDAAALYGAVVAEARRPEWYATYAVPDTIDGRFDMVALVLSLVLLRLEREGAAHDEVRLTECFIADMDGQIREIGFGDLGVGKQVGKIMSLLGGRLGAYRTAVDATTLERSLWRGHPPDAATVEAALRRVGQLRDRIEAAPRDALMAGRWA